jgi:hypothetical protein
MTSQIPSTRDSTAARVTSEMSGQRQYESRPPPHAPAPLWRAAPGTGRLYDVSPRLPGGGS